jgi:putative MATE family efflux protein
VDARLTIGAVLRLAMPAMASGLLAALFRPVDQYFVQDLGVTAQGALGASTMVTILAYAAMQVPAVGLAAFVGRATGAGRPEDRRRVVEQSLGAAGLLAIGLAALALIGTGALVDAIGLEGDGARAAAVYLRTLFVCGLALTVAPSIDAAFHAMGDTRLPLLLQLGAVLVNVVLTPILVPRLGIAGAALGTVVAQTIASGIGLWVLAGRIGLRWTHLRPGPTTPAVIRVGAPVGLASAMFGGVYALLMATTVQALGQDVYAGLGLGFGVLESVSWPLYAGLSVAASSLVARLIGAGRSDETVHAVRLCLAPAVVVGLAMTLVYDDLGLPIMDAFAEDPASFREGLRYASLLAVVQPLVAIEAVCEGVLAGSGDTRKLFWVNVPLNLVRVPLSWGLALSLAWGADGLWIAINVSTLLKASAKLALVLEGSWRNVELEG